MIQVAAAESLLVAMCVLFVGYFISRRSAFLKNYNIPVPIIGGLIMAVLITALHMQGITIAFDLPLKDTLMLMFFASVGLAANFKLLAKGGAKVFLFLGVATVYIVIQNTIGVSVASAFGLDPLLGLVAGSITLSGGHGTGAAWAQTFSETYGIETLELAMAAATFGLVMGGMIGGPVAQKLIKKHQLRSSYEMPTPGNHHIDNPDVVTYIDTEEDRITAKSTIQTLFVLLLCVVFAGHAKEWVDAFEISWLKIPNFVYALFIGVVITNLCDFTNSYKINKETLDALGTISLNLFLAMALMSLKLWELLDLALPLLAILLVQTVVLALFCYWVTFRVMGSNYDAAIMAGGHCGFGMGATPTAVMNMGTLVTRYGPSPQAFVVVPIVGAFFIDIANLIVLQTFIGFIR
ncbi:sodium/glutamate symporter [Paraferrimonas haliotis]|uniref:Sodium/glutamate symporter n=1 Tax=Paraferrimonas haliotis TaxID=2013866 RepID=A0AA37TN55_9GAMM|nr:sodium/glutamate symporter [Paraferrimonas haliotis]GLS84562.1 sodium/glutamate symporter [Paraferrimonas haliotis]